MPGKKCPFLRHFSRHLFITIEQLPGKKGPSPPYFFRHSSTFHKKCLAKNVLFTSTLFHALPVLLNKVYQTLFSLYAKKAWQKKVPGNQVPRFPHIPHPCLTSPLALAIISPWDLATISSWDLAIICSTTLQGWLKSTKKPYLNTGSFPRNLIWIWPF